MQKIKQQNSAGQKVKTSVQDIRRKADTSTKNKVHLNSCLNCRGSVEHAILGYQHLEKAFLEDCKRFVIHEEGGDEGF